MICTVIGSGVIVMHPALAYTLTVHAITSRGDGLRVSRPQPFLAAAAQAMGIDGLPSSTPGWTPSPPRAARLRGPVGRRRQRAVPRPRAGHLR